MHPDDEEKLRKELKPKFDIKSVEFINDICNLYPKFLIKKNIKIIKKLDSYDDLNVYIELDNINKKYCVKIHNGVESENLDILNCQNELLLTLSKEEKNSNSTSNYHIQVPIPILSSITNTYITFLKKKIHH